MRASIWYIFAYIIKNISEIFYKVENALKADVDLRIWWIKYKLWNLLETTKVETENLIHK